MLGDIQLPQGEPRLFELGCGNGSVDYWKNSALALSGRMDKHFIALWDHGHFKLWSLKTLGELLREAGLTGIRFKRAGRVPALAKSTIGVARKPKKQNEDPQKTSHNRSACH